MQNFRLHRTENLQSHFVFFHKERNLFNVAHVMQTAAIYSAGWLALNKRFDRMLGITSRMRFVKCVFCKAFSRSRFFLIYLLRVLLPWLG
jgi:hypothetical protein